MGGPLCVCRPQSTLSSHMHQCLCVSHVCASRWLGQGREQERLLRQGGYTLQAHTKTAKPGISPLP